MPTQAQAEAIKREVETWIAVQRERHFPDQSTYDYDHAAMVAVKLARSRPPHGVTEARDAVNPNDSSCCGHVTITKIAYRP